MFEVAKLNKDPNYAGELARYEESYYYFSCSVLRPPITQSKFSVLVFRSKSSFCVILLRSVSTLILDITITVSEGEERGVFSHPSLFFSIRKLSYYCTSVATFPSNTAAARPEIHPNDSNHSIPPSR